MMQGGNFEIFIPGIPRPQGSKRHVGGGRLVESSKYHAGWRQSVVQLCRLPRYRLKDPLQGALRCQLLFLMGKRTSKNVLIHPIAPPDLDKLVRTIFDALQIARIIRNDSQIVELYTRKQFADDKKGPGCFIWVSAYCRHDNDSQPPGKDGTS